MGATIGVWLYYKAGSPPNPLSESRWGSGWSFAEELTVEIPVAC